MVNCITRQFKKGQARFVKYVLNEVINNEFFNAVTDKARSKKTSNGETILTILVLDFYNVKTKVIVDMLPVYYREACLYEKEKINKRSKR